MADAEHAKLDDGTILNLADAAARQKIGSAELQTTAKDCSGAINELKQSLDDLVIHQTATAGSNITINKSDIIKLGHTVIVDIILTTTAEIALDKAMATNLPVTSVSNTPLSCKSVGSRPTEYTVRVFAGNLYNSDVIPINTQLHIYGAYNS